MLSHLTGKVSVSTNVEVLDSRLINVMSCLHWSACDTTSRRGSLSSPVFCTCMRCVKLLWMLPKRVLFRHLNQHLQMCVCVCVCVCINWQDTQASNQYLPQLMIVWGFRLELGLSRYIEFLLRDYRGQMNSGKRYDHQEIWKKNYNKIIKSFFIFVSCVFCMFFFW